MKIPAPLGFAAIATVIVAAAAGAGLWLNGSPGDVRRHRLDATRVENLKVLANAIDGYRKNRGALPPILGAIGLSDLQIRSLRDPVTRREFEYIAVDDRAYRLCAIFDTAEERPGDWSSGEGVFYVPPVSGRGDAFWKHPAGRYCFDLTAPVKE
ncbi:MAG TPA: hypothetical protein VKS60_10090 [Stellaceae bacterium]|nr:hypothetical protein [Stellaceae bacterium]